MSDTVTLPKWLFEELCHRAGPREGGWNFSEFPQYGPTDTGGNLLPSGTYRVVDGELYQILEKSP